MSKRTLLQGVGAFIGAASMGTQAMAATGRADGRWDLIVAGGGAAGMPAAIFAAERGAKVLLIERTGHLGGTLSATSGQLAAAGTRLQASKGIVDTPQAHFEDAMRISGGTADPRFVRLYTEHAAAVVDWLMDEGYRVRPTDPIVNGYNATFDRPRYIEGVERGASIVKAMLPAMKRGVDAGRITIVLHASVIDLVKAPSGAITGVVTEDEEGGRVSHAARLVLLTAGGVAGNPALYQRLHGVKLYGREAFQFNQGQALEAAVAAGGYVWHTDKYIPYFGAVLTDRNYPSPRVTTALADARFRDPWEIFVNSEGRRFVAEDIRDLRTRQLALAAQPGHRYWIVYDEAIRAAAPPLMPDLSAAAQALNFDLHPSFAKADTLHELAAVTGVDAASLAATVKAYDAAVASGTDPLGRRKMPAPIARPPFYAVLHQGWAQFSYAGLAVDERLRVIRQDGAPIPNLYAAGEIIGVGPTIGKALSNGGQATPALAFGRLLGKSLLPL